MANSRKFGVLGVLAAVCCLAAAPRAQAQVAPVFSSYTVLGVSSMSVTWTGTDSYQAVISSGASPATNGYSGNQFSASGVLTATFSGLATNTTYYVDVEDLSNGGSVTSFPSTSTLAALPAPNGPPQPSPNQISASWTPNNPPWTLFDCQISEDSGFSSLTGEQFVAGGAVDFTGLTPNTLYYIRVQAINNNGIPSGFVALDVGGTYTTPASSVEGFTGAGATTASLVWDSNGNPAGTFYTVVISTGGPSGTGTNGFSGNQSSTTVNTYATFFNLLPNTSYYAAVETLGNGGGNSPFTSLGSTITLANAPISAAPLLVTGTTITASWQADNNPPGTQYVVEISSYAVFSPFALSMSTTSLSFPFFGLMAVTTYYMQVQAVSYAGIATSLVPLPPAETLSSPPGFSTFTSVTSSQIQENWTANGNAPQNVYAAVLSSSPIFAQPLSSATANLFAVFSNLQANTTYYGEVSSSTTGGTLTQLNSTVTWAAAPTQATITAVSSVSISAAWNGGVNPPGTLYLLQAGAGSSFNTIVASVTTTSTSAALVGLTPLTTYDLEVQAVNYLGVGTAFDQFGSTTTLSNAAPPTPSLGATVLGTSSITWSWAGVTLATGYRVLSSTGGNISGDLPASIISWTEVGLSTNTAYANRLVAFDSIGNSTSAAVTAVTLAAMPGGAAIQSVASSSIAFSWSANTNPAGTQYAAQIWQQPVEKTSATTTSTSLVFSNLVAGATYFMDVYAVNSASAATAPTAAVSAYLPYFTSLTETIFPDTGGTLSFATQDGQVTVVFSPGTFPVTVTATLISPISPPHALSHAATLTATGVGLELDVVPALQPNEPISISRGYLDSEAEGLGHDALVLAYYDPINNLWVPVPSVSSASSDLVTGQASHLSKFQIMAVTAADNLSSAKVYPNPFRPALGESMITFSELPANARVRIYTVLGELVKDFSADATGIARWDATNESGKKVGSGTYFALAQGLGGKTILKVMIER